MNTSSVFLVTARTLVLLMAVGLLVVAIVGGRISLGSVSIEEHLSSRARIALAVFGVLLLLADGISMVYGGNGGSINIEPQQTLTRSPPRVVLAAPTPGTTVNGNKGTVVRGYVDDLGSRSLFVMDRSTNPLRYWPVNREPAAIQGERWAVEDAPIGDPGGSDIGETFEIVVVVCSKAASDRLRADAQLGRMSYPELPPGCEVVARTYVKRIS